MKNLSMTTEYKDPVCFALGFFDCVHLGHRALFEQATAMAGKCAAKVGAVTFSDNPSTAFGKTDKLLFTFEERKALLEEAGVEVVLALPFGQELRQTAPIDFLEKLTHAFDVKGFVCGYDYRFGANAVGDSVLLRQFCEQNGIMCSIVPPVLQGNARISSTRVKACLQNGDVKSAALLMGHSYYVSGVVCHGHGRGHLFSFPTANLTIPDEKLLPQDGVYATYVRTDGARYKAVTNVGDCPTFGDRNCTVETMLIDFSGDLYGKELRVEFVKRLREIRPFSSPQALHEQIERDTKWEENV